MLKHKTGDILRGQFRFNNLSEGTFIDEKDGK